MAGLLFALVTVALSAPAPGFDRTHALFASVLERFVDEGLVDYPALQKSPGDLDRYLDSMARVAEAELRNWPASDRIAFLLNVYNAQTLRLILDHYPVDGIKEIGGFFRGPWRQPVVRLFGETITLDDLEHGILRKQYREPRIHFALVCAARGCPPLRREPYVGERLDAQLDDQGRRFLSEVGKNRFDPGEGVLHLSPIFKWFRDDFTSKSGSVAGFVEPYLPEQASRALETRAEEVEIRYTDYDWSLNDRSRRSGGGRK